MSESVALKILKCPTCGASLKAKNDNEAITCVYCGNTVVPVSEAKTAPQNEGFAGFPGVVRVEGIKTSSSALAYMEQFFEDYDWEAFAYAQTLSVLEIDKLAASLKSSAADDKNTWFACFKAIAVPFVHKAAGCDRILNSVVEEYEKDNLDAYSKFDAYKRIAGMLSAGKEGVVANLEKFLAKAAQYGATDEELSELDAKLNEIKDLETGKLYDTVESIPEVRILVDERNAQIVSDLAEVGIDAQAEYDKAKGLIDKKQYVQALNVLLSLRGYADTKRLIEKIDKYYLITDILEIEGVLYCFRKNEADGTYALYATENGKFQNKPIIKNIGKMITNHADILYYLDNHSKLKTYNLATNVEYKLLDKTISKEKFYLYNRRVFMLADGTGADGVARRDVLVLDLRSGVVNTLLENVKDVIRFTGNKLVYTVLSKGTQTWTNIINVESKEIVGLGSKRMELQGFGDDYVVYTTQAPNAYNKNLYVKPLAAGEPERLIEQNIYKFCDIMAGKLFYYVGNSKRQSLITINADGTERREWPLYISEVLFEQGGWVYFIRRAGYNSVLCKSHLDGSKFSIIAADIKKFIEIKNGYLYYINDEATLVKVRMDGSNLQELCNDVEKILSVHEDKIIFVSVDDRLSYRGLDQMMHTRVVKSIYAVEFAGSGKMKLAYDVKLAKEYDENTVYYIASRYAAYTSADSNQDALYKLDVETNWVTKLMDLDMPQPPKSIVGIIICFVIMAILFAVGIIASVNEEFVVGLLSMLGAVINLIGGVVALVNRKKR